MLSLSPNIATVFFLNDPATTEIYTLSLHDALPICWRKIQRVGSPVCSWRHTPSKVAKQTCILWSHSLATPATSSTTWPTKRSEEHTSELQSRQYLVCRLLLEKKKNGQRCRAVARCD